MKAVPVEELKGMVGQSLGSSAWMEITQKDVNKFAEVTRDHQFIHVDPERAAATPFGGTIAHGYFTLSLLTALAPEDLVVPEGMKMAINYGMNKVRFLTPVKVGSKIRNNVTLKDVQGKSGNRVLVTLENSVEIEGEDKPAMVAESLALFYM